ncbi:MAG TPA: hypothetical protein VNN79_19915 [Actinomycetota bacterium]|nr:hypothetical protein [Actinomycetota bacterium]
MAVALGLIALAAYAAGAWVSGSLSPMARRALLDTSFVPQPYRWVNPPPTLAAANKQPDAGDFTVGFTKGRSDAGVFATNDQQASVVFALAAIPQSNGATSVHLTITPLDPATIGALPHDLHVLGNAYRTEATYEPSGDPVTQFNRRPLLIFVYPALASHGSDRTIVFAPDGKAWTQLKTTNDATNLQASTNALHLNGDYEVATTGPVSVGSPSPTPSGGGGSSPVAWVVIGAAVVVAAALVFLRLRSRARTPPAPPRDPRGGPEGKPEPRPGSSGSGSGSARRKR